MSNGETVNVRCMVDDVDEAIAFSTKVLGFELRSSAAPHSQRSLPSLGSPRDAKAKCAMVGVVVGVR